MYDQHLHTTISMDGKMTMEEACRRAFELGLEGICFTEHQEYGATAQKAAGEAPGYLIDEDLYAAGFREVQARWAGSLWLGKGVELGLRPDALDFDREYVKDRPLDLVLGSCHSVDGLELYGGEYCAGKTQAEAYHGYLACLHEMVEAFADFDVLGHLDLVRRNDCYPDREMPLSEYGAEIDAVLETLIRRGQGIEINAGGYRYGMDSANPSLEIVRRYRQLGGEIVTCGSDSHYVKTLGGSLDLAYQTAREAGFRYVAVFRGRRPQFCRI